MPTTPFPHIDIGAQFGAVPAARGRVDQQLLRTPRHARAAAPS